MTGSGVSGLFGRLNFLWPDARPLEKDKDLFELWFEALKPVEDDEVFEALPVMAQQVARRPSLAELVQAAKAVRASRPPLQLNPHIPHTPGYGEAWKAIGQAVRDHQLPRAELDSLAEKHKLYFAQWGEESTATPEMLAEVRALLARANAVPVAGTAAGSAPKFQSRYSDAHKAQYMANVAAKAAAEKAEK